jgi:hypothetical protein
VTTPTTDPSPRVTARVAGVFYLLTIVTGSLALVSSRVAAAATLAAALCYVAVTLLFDRLFRPVNPRLSRLAALVGLAGCAVGALNTFHLMPLRLNSLALFGVYCLLIGALILRSTFLPGVLGVLMAFGGLGWLTFALPSLARRLSPFNMLPGVLGETALTLWLLVFAVNEARWKEQAHAATEPAPAPGSRMR